MSPLGDFLAQSSLTQSFRRGRCNRSEQEHAGVTGLGARGAAPGRWRSFCRAHRVCVGRPAGGASWWGGVVRERTCRRAPPCRSSRVQSSGAVGGRPFRDVPFVRRRPARGLVTSHWPHRNRADGTRESVGHSPSSWRSACRSAALNADHPLRRLCSKSHCGRPVAA